MEAVKIVDNSEITGRLRGPNGESSNFRTSIPYPDTELVGKLVARGVRISGGPRGRPPLQIFFDILPWVVGLFYIWFMFRQVQGSGNRAFSFGKSRAKQYLDTGKRITFNDVAGQEEAKYELQEVVEFLKNPAKFAQTCKNSLLASLAQTIRRASISLGTPPPGTLQRGLSRGMRRLTRQNIVPHAEVRS